MHRTERNHPHSSVGRSLDLKTRGFGFDSRTLQPNKCYLMVCHLYIEQAEESERRFQFTNRLRGGGGVGRRSDGQRVPKKNEGKQTKSKR